MQNEYSVLICVKLDFYGTNNPVTFFLNSAKLIQNCTNNSTQKMKNISKKRIQKSFYPNYTQRATTFSIQKFNE